MLHHGYICAVESKLLMQHSAAIFSTLTDGQLGKSQNDDWLGPTRLIVKMNIENVKLQ